MRIKISGIPVDIQKKDIKNIHLSVMPPNGEVRVSAPLQLQNNIIKTFLRAKTAWIRNQQESLDDVVL